MNRLPPARHWQPQPTLPAQNSRSSDNSSARAEAAVGITTQIVYDASGIDVSAR